MIPTLYATLTGGPMFVARGWSHACGKQLYREVPLLWQMTSKPLVPMASGALHSLRSQPDGSGRSGSGRSPPSSRLGEG